MARRGPAKTLTEGVYLQLRADVLAGRLSPGEPLKAAEISTRFAVSVAVVREALTRLTEQGLAQSEPNRGFVVTPLSHDVLQALVGARAINDGAALRSSMERGDLDWEANVLAAHHRLAGTPEYETDDPARITEDWAAAHTMFHASLLQACGNATLLDICARLWSATELYRRWSLPQDARRDVRAEHAALMTAALDRDVPRAVERLLAHMYRTTDALREITARTD
ncbi:MAG: GntR family transcriptional regulator [Chloroflexi bacterium]|nr:GntR family transcriptional regulator [Chloroflexota bacterium]